MEIRWILDEPADDGESILGEIYLISNGAHIHDECIFLDVWFYHLLLSAQHLMKEDSYLIDELEEPDSLKIDRLADGLYFSYGKQGILVSSMQEFAHELKRAAKEFYDRAIQIPDSHKNPALQDILLMCG